jgi:hypothetical protein
MGGSQANKECLLGVASKNNSETLEACRTPPLLDLHKTAIVDSGCTGHFLLVNAPCHNKIKSISPLRVRLPNGDTVDSTHTASLGIPELSEAAYVSHVFPYMAIKTLLYVGQLYNEGYSVIFKIYGVTIFNTNGKTILKCQRYASTGLWCINFRSDKPQMQIPESNHVYELCNIVQES